jgi:predicted amidohydrolase YtcJ
MAGSSTTTLFTNGKVFLSGVEPGTNPLPAQPPTFAESILIRDSAIAFVGPSDSPTVKDALASGTTTVVDLAGKTVLPGFIDGHMHLMLLGQSLQKLDLGHCKNLADIQTAIRDHAAANPDLPRVLCRGWMHSMTPDGVTARDLDDLDPLGRPVLIDTKDLHSTWANTPAIADLGADAWPDITGGVIERDAAGRPTGVFSEAANITFVWPYLTAVSTLAERTAAIRAAVSAYHAEGYTGMIDMAMDEGAWEALQETAATTVEDRLPMRVAAYWLIKPKDTDEENLCQVERAAELAALHNSRTSPDCRIVGIKVICDGIIDACTAGLTEPYLSNGASPMPLWKRELLEPVVRRATELGLQISLHAIGDATITMAADLLEAHASRAHRPRMEHIELPSSRDAARLGALGITASIQPVHADPAILRAWPRLLGPERCKRAFPYREFADGGAPLALGSDSPTAPHAPLGNLYVGTTRRSYREPEYETTVNAHFALGLCEAVAAATEGAAYSCFDEGRTGRLAEGLKADFVVVDMQWEKTKLMEGRIKQTWFDGKKVWDSEDGEMGLNACDYN